MGFRQSDFNSKKLAELLGIEESELKCSMNQSRVGGFARIWEYHDITNGATIKVNDKEITYQPGDYSLVKLTTWKKKKGVSDNTGLQWNEIYNVDFQDGFVRLIGSAHKKAQELNFGDKSFDKGLTIQITSCEVTTPYNYDTKKSYTNYAIFAFEVPDGDGSYAKGGKKTVAKSAKSTKAKTAPIEEDDDLPF